MKVNALEWFNNIKESSTFLGLSKRVSKNYEKDKEWHEKDFNDAILDDLMDMNDFFKVLDNSIQEEIKNLSFPQELEYCKSRTFLGLNLSEESENINLYFYVNIISIDGFTIGVSVSINDRGNTDIGAWNISRKWRFFDVFFRDLVEIVPRVPKGRPNILFKPTERALNQVKEVFKLFANHYQEILSTISKVDPDMLLNRLKPGNIKKLVGDVLYNIKKREGL